MCFEYISTASHLKLAQLELRVGRGCGFVLGGFFHQAVSQLEQVPVDERFRRFEDQVRAALHVHVQKRLQLCAAYKRAAKQKPR